MVSNPVKRHWTVEEYLAHEAETGIRHEYIDGEIYAMSGGTEKHSAIIANCIIAIGQQVRNGPCRVHTSDLRVKISESKFVYPDFSVVCGDAKFADDKHTMLLNPTLVAEVISPSSADYDLGSKGNYYRSLLSLQAYLLLDQEQAFAQLYTRRDNGWHLQDFSGLDVIVPLDAINCTLPLSEAYRNVDLA